MKIALLMITVGAWAYCVYRLGQVFTGQVEVEEEDDDTLC